MHLPVSRVVDDHILDMGSVPKAALIEVVDERIRIKVSLWLAA